MRSHESRRGGRRCALLALALVAASTPIIAQEAVPTPKPPRPAGSAAAPAPEPGALAELTEDDVGAVNDRPVSRAEFEAYLTERFIGEPAGQGLIADLRDRTLIEMAVKRLGIELTDAEVDAAFKEIAGRVAKETDGKQTLDDYLSAKGTTVAEFKTYLSRLVAARKVVRLEKKLAPNAQVSDAEVSKWLQAQATDGVVVTDRKALPNGAVLKVGDRTYTAVDFGRELLKGLPLVERARELDRLLKHRLVTRKLAERSLSVTSADLDAAIAEDRKRYATNPQTKGVAYEQILAQMGTSIEKKKADANFRSSVAVMKMARALFTDQDLEAYFNAHPARFGESREVRHILVRVQDPRRPFAGGIDDKAAKKRIDEIVAKLAGGEAFEKVARANSDDRSRFNGGYVGRIYREGRMDPVFAAAAFKLAAGSHSAPIRTDYGYHVVKVDRVIPAPPFETVKPQILRARAKEWFKDIVKANALQNRYLDELRAERKAAMEEAAKKAPAKATPEKADG